MKKLCKFIFGTISLAALAGGAFYFLKSLADKRAAEDFDDFEDDFDEIFEDDLDNFHEEENHSKDSREYVSIDLSTEATKLPLEATSEETNEDVSISADTEEEIETTPIEN